MDLKDFLREQRALKGLSQRELSKLSGVSNSEISRIESGERKNPSHRILHSLADAFELPVTVFLDKAGYFRDSYDLAEDYRLPPELLNFIKEEADRDWIYIRLAEDLSRIDLTPEELLEILEAEKAKDMRADDL